MSSISTAVSFHKGLQEASAGARGGGMGRGVGTPDCPVTSVDTVMS